MLLLSLIIVSKVCRGRRGWLQKEAPEWSGRSETPNPSAVLGIHAVR